MNFWPELSPETTAQIEAALRRGQKIEAIKIYRDATHCGLKEAKDAIERGDSIVADASTNDVVVRASGPNWLTIIFVLISLAIAAVVILLRMR
jgi:hydrogenase maturation factor